MDTITAKKRLDVIFNFICNYYGVTEEEVRSKSRLRDIVMLRKRFYWLTRKHFYNEISLEVTGSFLGQDHSTAIHACKTLQDLIDTDRYVKRDIDKMNYTFIRDVKPTIEKKKLHEIPKNEYQKIKKERNDAYRKVNDMYYTAKIYLHDFRAEVNNDLVMEGFRKERLNRLVEQKLKDLNNIKMRFN